GSVVVAVVVSSGLTVVVGGTVPVVATLVVGAASVSGSSMPVVPVPVVVVATLPALEPTPSSVQPRGTTSESAARARRSGDRSITATIANPAQVRTPAQALCRCNEPTIAAGQGSRNRA